MQLRKSSSFVHSRLYTSFALSTLGTPLQTFQSIPTQVLRPVLLLLALPLDARGKSNSCSKDYGSRHLYYWSRIGASKDRGILCRPATVERLGKRMRTDELSQISGLDFFLLATLAIFERLQTKSPVNNRCKKSESKSIATSVMYSNDTQATYGLVKMKAVCS